VIARRLASARDVPAEPVRQAEDVAVRLRVIGQVLAGVGQQRPRRTGSGGDGESASFSAAPAAGDAAANSSRDRRGAAAPTGVSQDRVFRRVLS